LTDDNLISFCKTHGVAERGKDEDTKPSHRNTAIQYDSNGIRIETEEMKRNWREI